MRPQYHLGQSFLTDERVLAREVGYAQISAGDTVLEVGAGIGNLTRRLAARAGHVIAIEYDRQFQERLDGLARACGNVTPLWGDALAVPLPPFSKAVANLPYRIALPVIFRLLDHPFITAVLMVQQNMAQHICAGPGDKGYSRISVTVGRQARTELLDIVPRSAFSPPPEVDSAVVRLHRISDPFGIASTEAFKRLLDHSFRYRHDRLAVVLDRLPGAAAVVPLLPGKLRNKRVAQLTPEEFGEVSRFLDAHKLQLPAIRRAVGSPARSPRSKTR